MSLIIKSKTFDATNIQFDRVAKNKAGGNIVYFKYNVKEEQLKKIVLQTPKLIAPFGLSTFVDDITGITKYSIDLSFRNENEDKSIQNFKSMIQQIDSYMIENAVINSKEWFGKKLSLEVVKELYRPLIKYSRDPSKYADTIKFKIRNNIENIDAFDENKEKFDMNNFTSGSSVRCIVELASIWFVNKQFGCSLSLVQIQVFKLEKIQGFSFESDSDDETDCDS